MAVRDYPSEYPSRCVPITSEEATEILYYISKIIKDEEATNG